MHFVLPECILWICTTAHCISGQSWCMSKRWRTKIRISRYVGKWSVQVWNQAPRFGTEHNEMGRERCKPALAGDALCSGAKGYIPSFRVGKERDCLLWLANLLLLYSCCLLLALPSSSFFHSSNNTVILWRWLSEFMRGWHTWIHLGRSHPNCLQLHFHFHSHSDVCLLPISADHSLQTAMLVCSCQNKLKH